MNAHDYEFTSIDGHPLRLADYAGRVILLVNTASECVTTPQYAALQRLWERYGAHGFAVIGVPSNDFGEQEPGDEAAIRAFCNEHYGVTFPLTTKQRVVPPDEHPLYRDLGTFFGDAGRPTWNFHKYLIDGDGEFVDLWDSRTPPDDPEIVAAIEHQLGVDG